MSKKLLFNFNREVIQNYTYVKYVGTIITATNTLEKPIKSAILKGSTKYRDIDTGDVLDTFDETKNLELVSVKMPVLKTVSGFNLLNPNAEPIAYQGNDVLHPDYFKAKFGDSFSVTKKTSGELWCSLFCYDSDKNLIKAYYQNNFPVPRTITLNDDSLRDVAYVRYECAKWTPFKDIMLNYGEQMPFAEYNGEYKSNILTVNEDVTLRSNGDVCDELNLLTGRLTQRIDENNEVLAQEVVKTVDLSILDQNENKVSSISTFNDTTHIMASSETIPPIFEGYLATKEVE